MRLKASVIRRKYAGLGSGGSAKMGCCMGAAAGGIRHLQPDSKTVTPRHLIIIDPAVLYCVGKRSPTPLMGGDFVRSVICNFTLVLGDEPPAPTPPT